MINKFVALVATTLLAAPAFAEEMAAHSAGGGITNSGIIALAAGLVLGLAAFGGALGQGKTAAAALEGLARNPQAQPQIFVPMIIGLALIESLVIYAFVIAIMLYGKV